MYKCEVISGPGKIERWLKTHDDQTTEDEDGRIIETGPLSQVADYVIAVGCRSMVIEEHIIDEEYFREFLTFYATTHVEHPPTAIRLHFFAASESTVRRAIDARRSGLTTFARGAYLGYCVVRPTSPMTVGETLLRAPDVLGNRTCHVHCATTFGQTLQGKRFKVAAAPFIGQDQTGMCAQAALWGACKYLHKYRYYPKISMPEITLLANAREPTMRFTRPADGLSRAAVYSVLKDIGFQVYVTEPHALTSDADSPREAIYTAIESGLPALLLLSSGGNQHGHAVWAVGHVASDGPYDPATPHELAGNPFKSDSLLAYRSASARIRQFLVHDDGVGPYLPATIEWPETGLSKATSSEKCTAETADGETGGEACRSADRLLEIQDRLQALEAGLGTYVTGSSLSYSSYDDLDKPLSSPASGKHEAVVTHVIVPLPGEVFVKPPEARHLTVTILRRHLATLHEQTVKQQGELCEATTDFIAEMTSPIEGQPPPYVLRTFLCQSAVYLEHIVGSAISTTIKQAYTRHIRFPEYIWVTELAAVDRPDQVLGELILDSTNSSERPASRGFAYLGLHIPHGLWLAYDPEPDRGSLVRLPHLAVNHRFLVVDEDPPYGPFTKNSDTGDPPRSHRNLGPIRF